jgi:putative transposase
MANRFTSIHIHLVFSTKNRDRRITPEIESKVWSYMGGICKSHGIKPIHIGGVEDHLHLLIGLPPTIALSQCMRRLKGESSKWISEQWPAMKTFARQDGYGAFCVGKSQVSDPIGYITR